MTQDEIIEMARQAGLIRAGDGWTEPMRWGASEIKAFAKLVAAKEREACAKVADLHSSCLNDTPNVIAIAIRARGVA